MVTGWQTQDQKTQMSSWRNTLKRFVLLCKTGHITLNIAGQGLAVYLRLIFSSQTKVQGAFVVTLMLPLGWAWGSHFKVLCQSFLCDGQGADRRASLYEDRYRLLILL